MIEPASGPIKIDVTVGISAANGAARVSYATLDGSAVAPGDYGAKSGRIRFGRTQLTKVLHIRINADTVHEGPETFEIVLFDPANTAINRSVATVTILAN
ncbi:MAG TPA: Calx-beta domain-containing protein [Acidimicrobiia bacterium]|nr:Calx-beta domain-containing protein [Acidimicrobiia bacterium]